MTRTSLPSRGLRPSRRHPAGLARLCLAFLVLLAGPAWPVTITEIHYDPPGESSGLEFVELHNDTPTVADLSGYAFTEGIDYTFPSGSLVPGGGYVVLCANRAAFSAAYPEVTPLGEFSGRLDSDGETLVLTNNGGGVVVRIRYRDREKWPGLPRGTGRTLSLRKPFLPPSEPESWAPSAEIGGTPGRANFGGNASQQELIPLGATWSYKKGTEEFSNPVDAWKQPGFVPTGWFSGAAGFGYADGDDTTTLDDMQGGYISLAILKTFAISAADLEEVSSVMLEVSYDDGFVAYLNGAEVARSGLPGAPGDPVPFSAAAASHEAGVLEAFSVSTGLLVEGTNVLAVQGHNADLAGSSDFSLHPRLYLEKSAGGSGGGELGVVFNELLGRAASGRFLELYNKAASSANLGGFHLSDNPSQLSKYTLPANSILPSHGFLVVTEAQSGLDLTTAEVALYLTRPDGNTVAAATVFENVPRDGLAASRTGFSDARLPDGAANLVYAAVPTPGAPNTLTVSRDVVINELFYNPPITDTAGEFIELYNRGAAPVSLGGWAFTKGISFVFPSLALPPGGYLVIAQDPAALSSLHGISGVLGPYEGSLSNSGENVRLVDSVGNTVDEVRYHDGGRWSSWADGGGSSLELIDPRQDNDFATAWDASDESSKSAWTRVSYSGSYTAEATSELHLLLLEAGHVLVDDVSLQRTGSATEYIPNGTFEATTNPWLIQGTHSHSVRRTDVAHTGAACLELIATGGGDNGVNKLDTDTSPSMANGTYTVSLWTKWLRGSSAIITRADSRTGASLQRVSRLGVPAALGTPGNENSVRVALKAVDPSGNLGPVIGDVTQRPVAPTGQEPVRVLARASDADGVASLAIRYRTGGVGNGIFSTSPMFDDGAHGDGAAADGAFAGEIPAFANGTLVVFYLEGADTAGKTRRFPVNAPESTLLYGVQGPVGGSLFVSKTFIDDENNAELRSRLLHSDDLVDGSFVFNDEEIYYNVGYRYHGSPWNRPPDPKMFRIRFNEDQEFIHDLKSINLSRYGNAQNEATGYFCVQRNSRPGVPAPAGDYFYSRVYLNTGFHGNMAIVETVDSRYVEKWFPEDPDGFLHKIPGRRYLNDGGTMDGVDWVTLAYRGSTSNSEEESYRWYFPPGTRQEEDQWAPLVALCSVMDVNRTNVPTFDAQVEDILDVEQFLRVEAARVLQDDWDTIGIGNGQNAYLYYAPLEQRWKLLPWDTDHTFGNVSAKLYPEGSEAQITRLIQRPQYRRMYLRILDEMTSTYWNTGYMGPYLTQTANIMGSSGAGIQGFIASRFNAVRALIPSATELRITRVGTQTVPAVWNHLYYSSRPTERVTGTGPISLETVAVLQDGEQIFPSILWSSTTWSFDAAVLSPESLVEVVGLDSSGAVRGTDSFTLVSTADWAAPTIATIAPAFGPTDGGTVVKVTGQGFREGARVLFGTREATTTQFVGETELRATTPPAGSGAVNLKVENVDRRSAQVTAGFEYVSPLAFLRGDANLDGGVDLADPIRILLHLFAGSLLQCLDAGDVQNDGTLNLTDAVLLLDYLFKNGPAPAAPFPLPGEDPAVPAGSLGCAQGL